MEEDGRICTAWGPRMHLGRGVGGTCTIMRLHISFYLAVSQMGAAHEGHLAVCFTWGRGVRRVALRQCLEPDMLIPLSR